MNSKIKELLITRSAFDAILTKIEGSPVSVIVIGVPERVLVPEMPREGQSLLVYRDDSVRRYLLTSPVESVTFKNDKILVKTKNSAYVLEYITSGIN